MMFKNHITAISIRDRVTRMEIVYSVSITQWCSGLSAVGITNGTGLDSTSCEWCRPHHALLLTGSVYMGPAPVSLCPSKWLSNYSSRVLQPSSCWFTQWCSTKANTYPDIIVILNKLGVSKQASLQHGLEEGQVDHVEKQQPQNGEVHNDGNLHVQKDSYMAWFVQNVHNPNIENTVN